MSIVFPLLKKIARKFNVSDQVVDNLAACSKLGKPSEVLFPSELLSEAARISTQGLYNYSAIQTKQDWIWPFWVAQQYDPDTESFIPRAFQGLSVNVTQRNWKGFGLPFSKPKGIVDPRGLMTPKHFGWSLDVWLEINEQVHYPSKLLKVEQRLISNLPIIETSFEVNNHSLNNKTLAILNHEHELAESVFTVENNSSSVSKIRLYLSIRPYNPEGLSPIFNISFEYPGYFVINGFLGPILGLYPDGVICSNQDEGDVGQQLPFKKRSTQSHDPAGLCTSAVCYEEELESGKTFTVKAYTPMTDLPPSLDTVYKLQKHEIDLIPVTMNHWQNSLRQGMMLTLPNRDLQTLFETCKADLLLSHDGEVVVPGPFTYKTFWFRDAAYLLTALDRLGYTDKVQTVLKCFPVKQQADGYFLSQKGEWDSNGQALWTLGQHYRYTRNREWLNSVYPSMWRGAEWIERKRLTEIEENITHHGLLPAGFSAEHLGLSDYYYWDNFWALAGLREMVFVARALGHTEDRERFSNLFRDLKKSVEKSLEICNKRLEKTCIPSSPYKSIDSGAIGSLCAFYPLYLLSPTDERLTGTLNEIRKKHLRQGMFFHQIFHSGWNTYLTCHIAQCYLSRGDLFAYELLQNVLQSATPVYTYPEAIHPRTHGGCMGDGHHLWAAADIVHLIRNFIMIEDEETLTIFPCPISEWFEPGCVLEMRYGYNWFGSFDLSCETNTHSTVIHLQARYHTVPDAIYLNLPFQVVKAKINGKNIDEQKLATPNRLILDPAAELVEIWR